MPARYRLNPLQKLGIGVRSVNWRIVASLVLMALVPACSGSVSPPSPSPDAAKAAGDPASDAPPILQREVHSLARRNRGGASENPVANIKVELANHAQLMERVQQHRGKVVVVDVWSTSCVPCMQEFPHLVELARKWPEDVMCVSMNVDFIGLPNKAAETYVDKVVEFLTEQQADPSNLVNIVANEPDTDVLAKLDVESMPAILVVDRSGQTAAKLTINNAGSDGLTYAGDVFPLVEKLVSDSSNPASSAGK